MYPHNEFDYLARSVNDLGEAGSKDLLASYNSARDKDFEQLRAIQTNPQLVQLVRSRTKGAVQRTAAIPLKCGPRETGESVALKVIGGEVHLVLLDGKHSTRASHGNEPSLDRVVTKEFGEAPLEFSCCEYGKRSTKLTLASLMRLCLSELAAAGRKRPSIQLHA